MSGLLQRRGTSRRPARRGRSLAAGRSEGPRTGERSLRLMRTLMIGISSAPDLAAAMARVLTETTRQARCGAAEAWVRTEEGWSRAASFPARGSRASTLRAAEFLTEPAGAGGRAAAFRWLAPGDPAVGPARRRAMDALGLSRLAVVPVNDRAQPVAALLLSFEQEADEPAAAVELVRAAVEPLGALVRHKRVEETLARHEDQLAAIVREQTAQLEHTHAQLRMTDRLASIGTLAAGLGHDMNNVLLPVRARLGALKVAADRGELPARAFSHVEEIRKSVGYLQQLADGLHFLAMDPEARESGETPTRLHDWWARVGPLISRAVPRHVRVAADIPADLPAVAAASHRLTQAALNLIVNAGEAIPARSSRRRGAARVRLWARAAPQARFVLLGVTDNGVGMTEAVKRRAFEMFFTTKTRGLGTGLGLPLVQRVAASAGGHVAIESAPGRGTTVTMSLQAVAAPATLSGLTAAVTVPDARAASFIRQVLETGGVAMVSEPRAVRAGLWVLDADVVSPAAARAWRRGRATARLVLLGTPARRALAAWHRLSPIIIERRDDLGLVRAALSRALGPEAEGRLS